MEVVRQMAAAAAVVALLGAALWWLRRRGLAVALPGRRASRRRLECAERLALGPQQALHLVRVGERGLLLASWPSGCALLGNFPWRECAAGLVGQAVSPACAPAGEEAQ